jgi:hypothetical protein
MSGFTLAQLTALESAIARGVLRVKVDGQEVQYQSTSEMLALRDRMRADLIEAGLIELPSQRRQRATLCSYSPD